MNMPDNKSAQLKKRIAEYSRFSITVLLLNQLEVQAEVIYTNIDPDTSLINDFDAFTIDMNNDGILDFGFWNFSYWTYTSTSEFVLFQRIWALPSNNEIAGNTFISWELPYAFSGGQRIDADLNFNTNYIQRMAFRTYYTIWNGTDTETLQGLAGGNWYPEVLDHYLGVRFLDIDAQTHYGWIRCDVKDEGRTLVIKDFAYEVKPDIGIYAGDTIGDTTVQVLENTLTSIEMYSFNRDVYINLNDLRGAYLVEIWDLAGQLIYKNDLLESNTKISPNAPAGIYVVKISHEEKQLTRKLILN